MKLGKKGNATLYLFFDFIIAGIVFAWMYMAMDNQILNQATNIITSHPDPTGVINRIIGPWHIIPIAFVIACIVRIVYGKVWILGNPRSLLVWLFITISLGVFNFVYITYDYYISYILPGMIPNPSEALTAMNLWINIWQDILPWGVHLVICIYAIVIQDYTPTAQINKGDELMNI